MRRTAACLQPNLRRRNQGIDYLGRMMGAKSIKRRRKAMRRMPLFMRFGSGWSLNLAGQQPGLTAAA
jgi:hypothetical protein